METKLAENIRSFRKKRSLTQEQLAEVLSVTTGAVYKWESKLSVPDIGLILQMADFFDVSLDVLFGYEMKDNRLEATVKRLQECRRNKDRAGLDEAEKALKKYPHSFKIVNECATVFRAFLFETKDKKLGRRALELTERSLTLLPQNTDPEISEQTLYGKMAEVYLCLGETEKGIELYKKHNAGGFYNHKIGSILADSEHSEDAAPYLSQAMANLLAELISVVSGYVNYYGSRGDHASAEAILQWGIDLLFGLRRDGKPNFFDKVNSGLLAAAALTQLLQGREDDARESLKKAKELAEFFDASPSYDESDIRFMERIEGASVHDDIGATAMDAVANIVKQGGSGELAALWKEVCEGDK
jgi:transcriptional regulator with XRE-family HTH domain